MAYPKALAATLLAGAALLGSASTAAADGLPLVGSAAPVLDSVVGQLTAVTGALPVVGKSAPTSAGLPALGQLALPGVSLPGLGGQPLLRG
ncbi:hypothetical protein [Streptomyces nojiriensis]|uniref:hypothetical protein n=1 Tax=Streptomyces nojiriensis TaxID=66374 RepID=UPI00367D0DDE